MAGKLGSVNSVVPARKRFGIATVCTLVSGALVAGGLAAPLGGAAHAAGTCTVNPGLGNVWTTPDIAKVQDGHALYGAIHDMGAQSYYSAGYMGQDKTTGQAIDVALIDSGVSPVPGLNNGNVVQGPDLSFESQSPALSHIDTNGHGTMMASIIAGRDNPNPPISDFSNAQAFLGVAPKARVVSLKVADSEGAVDVTQVIQAIDWTVAHKNTNGFNIRVINLSYGVVPNDDWTSDALSFAVDQAWKAGIVVVVAAGNGGAATGKFSPGLTSPAYNKNIIAVGAYDDNGTTGYRSDDYMPAFTSGASSSNKRQPDFVVPAEHITGLHVKGSAQDDAILASCIASGNPATFPATVFGPNDRFIHGSGTSQAAALTSGAVALILSQNPGLTPDQVKKIMNSNAVSIGTGGNLAGNGELNLAKTYGASVPNYTQSNNAVLGGGTLYDARGSSIVKAFTETTPGACAAGNFEFSSPTCTLYALIPEVSVFGSPLDVGGASVCGYGCSGGFEYSEWVDLRMGYPSTPTVWYEPRNSWEKCEKWGASPFASTQGIDLLGTAMVPDSRPGVGQVWASCAQSGGTPSPIDWTKNWAGLPMLTTDTHAWSSAGYWTGGGNWARHSLTGYDWTSHSLRDNSWS